MLDFYHFVRATGVKMAFRQCNGVVEMPCHRNMMSWTRTPFSWMETNFTGVLKLISTQALLCAYHNIWYDRNVSLFEIMTFVIKYMAHFRSLVIVVVISLYCARVIYFVHLHVTFRTGRMFVVGTDGRFMQKDRQVLGSSWMSIVHCKTLGTGVDD